MKNLTKLFITVVAGMLAFSCVTDTTEDQAVQLGSGQTTLSISLDGTRTHLGENTGDGYPLYWSAGDKVAVNGYTSAEIASQYVGTSGAEFTFNTSELGDMYNLVYPAPAEDVTASATAGLYPVVFPASQSYNAANPAEVAAPMYGYAPAGETMTLQHLSGVLRFLIKGNGEVLESIEIRSESGKIAGIFDVNCADGTLTAREDAGNTVTVSFGEGLTLGEEATIVHVAVPSGNYGIFAVILHTASDSMVLNFDSSAKPINKGRVREFSEFTYKANADNDGVYIIDSKEDLIRFAKIASKFQEYTTYTSAKVAATIDMKGVEWTPIEGFDGAFDGGSKEGYEIQNLTAPLFGTTTATEIKNVKLTDANIKFVGAQEVGAIACKIDNTEAVVSNCSASGKMVLENNGELSSNLFSAGLIAISTSEQTFSNLTNEIDIEISGTYSAKNLYVCGCVGSAENMTAENFTNLGNLTFKDIVSPRACLCGVVGLAKVLNNCVNGEKGNPAKGCLKYEGVESASFWAGGISGVTSLTTTLTNCVNYGSIIATENSKAIGIIVGGIYANCQSDNSSRIFTFDGCANHGYISIKPISTNGNVKVGGGWAQVYGKNSTFKVLNGFTNTGDIDVDIDNVVSGTVLIGGAVSTFSKGLHADSNGVIKNEGNITYTCTDSKAPYTRVAGVLAHTAVVPLASNNLSYVNTGDITAKGEFGTTGYVGGIMGTGRNISNARNFCNIEASGATYVATILPTSETEYMATNCHSGGSIKVNDNEKVTLTPENYYEYIYPSGNTADLASTNKCGWLADINAVPLITGNFENIGSAEDLLAFDFSSNKDIRLTDNIDLTGKSWTTVEGYEGSVHGNNKTITGLTAPLLGTVKSSIADLRLEGVNIEITDISATPNLGVLANKIDNTNAVVYNCSAEGAMNINCNMTSKLDVSMYISGLIGNTTSVKEFKNIVNEIDIEVNGYYLNDVRCAGCVGYIPDGSLNNAQNLGTITYNGSCKTTVYLGGICNSCKHLTDCTNGSADDSEHLSGSLIYKGVKKSDETTNKSVLIGGMTGRTNGEPAIYTRCKNYGSLIVDEVAETNGTIYLGGMVGYSDTLKTFDSCANYGPMELNAKSVGDMTRVGGLISAVSTADVTILNGYTNGGDILVNQKEASGDNVQIGGCFANFSAPISTSSTGVIKNTGAITYSGTSTQIVRVGGLFAAMNEGSNIPDVNGEILRYENSGDITITGTGSTITAGGIYGNINYNIRNARCYCSIEAIGLGGNVGMIMAGTRSNTRKAVNCLVGGSICTSTTGKGESEQKVVKNLSASNYFNYIYSSADWTGVADYDGCGYIESIDDANPEYATQQPAE